MAVLTKTLWLSRVAAAFALVALVLFALVFVPALAGVKSTLFNAAFVAAAAALLFAAAGTAPGPEARMVFRPTTRLGWWAVGFVVGAGVLFGVAAALSVVVPVASAALSGVLGAGMVSGGVAALVAWLRRHERSWLVLLMIVPAMIVLYLLAAVIVFPY